MGVIRTIFGSLEPEYRAELAHAVLPRRMPNAVGIAAQNGVTPLAPRRRVMSRSLDELIAMCRLVLADDTADEAEARFLLDWIETNLHGKDVWPGSVLFERLSRAMNDRLLDPHEETELLDVLRKANAARLGAVQPGKAGVLFDDPAPVIVYPAKHFALTGQFLYGSRKRVSAAIETRGGVCTGSISRKGGYLLVGTLGADEWRADDLDTKIADAVALRAAGSPVVLVSERHWAGQLT